MDSSYTKSDISIFVIIRHSVVMPIRRFQSSIAKIPQYALVLIPRKQKSIPRFPPCKKTQKNYNTLYVNFRENTIEQ